MSIATGKKPLEEFLNGPASGWNADRLILRSTMGRNNVAVRSTGMCFVRGMTLGKEKKERKKKKRGGEATAHLLSMQPLYLAFPLLRKS